MGLHGVWVSYYRRIANPRAVGDYRRRPNLSI
jgi:hypothetical protein